MSLNWCVCVRDSSLIVTDPLQLPHMYRDMIFSTSLGINKTDIVLQSYKIATKNGKNCSDIRR